MTRFWTWTHKIHDDHGYREIVERRLTIGPLTIGRDVVTFDEPTWIVNHKHGYMYMSPTLCGVIYQTIRYWRHDSAIVG